MKKTVGILLPQNDEGIPLTKKKKLSLYESFKKRVQRKSNDNYYDKGSKPKLLRLYLIGSVFNSITEFLVQYNSFEVLYGKTPGTTNTEIGFSAIVKTIIVDKPFKLTVYKKSFKANLTLLKEEN